MSYLQTQYTCPLLSNGSESTYPLQEIATNESLPGNKLLNTKIFPWQHNTTEGLFGMLTYIPATWQL
jgi:hypothetical protein